MVIENRIKLNKEVVLPRFGECFCFTDNLQCVFMRISSAIGESFFTHKNEESRNVFYSISLGTGEIIHTFNDEQSILVLPTAKVIIE